jgi:hypothetical protein
MGGKPKKATKLRVADRYRSPESEEDWETTYKSAVNMHDLRKATRPFHALLH